MLKNASSGRRMIALVLASAGLVLITAATALATLQSWDNVGIASTTAGWTRCNAVGIHTPHESAVFRAKTGTRHPYRGATYDQNDNAIPGQILPQISDNGSYGLGEGSAEMLNMRIDNQATNSGVGYYYCETY